jgi:hypothetical protein
MTNSILVSLVSQQTIPNVELIKEFGDKINKHLFITTAQMQNQLEWIKQASGIGISDVIEVDAFDTLDIKKKLGEYPFGDDEIIVNVTGGTKLMSLVIDDFFRSVGATIYYVTGYNKEFIKLYPSRGVIKFEMKNKITLNEYLISYGFEIEEGSVYKQKNDALMFMNYYLNNFNELKPVLSTLQPARNKKRIEVKAVKNLNKLLSETNIIKPDGEGMITKYDIRYLTGDWFEEYVYFKVKEELNLDDTEIGKGYKINKDGVSNELDIMFIYRHKLYIIECKTSVSYTQNILQNGVEKEKNTNLLGEILYKSDALRNKFGLFANTSVFTLSPIRDTNGKTLENMKDHIKRAKLSNVTIAAKQDIVLNKSIRELLKIN